MELVYWTSTQRFVIHKMNFLKNNKKGGLSIVEILILSIFLVIVLANLFKVDLKAKYQSQEAQITIHQTKSFMSDLWNDYLKEPVIYLWDAFIDNMQRIHNGEKTDIDLYGESINPANFNSLD